MAATIRLFWESSIILLLFSLASVTSCTVISDKDTPVVVVDDPLSIEGRLDLIECEITRLEKYQTRSDVLVERSFNSTSTILETLTVVIALATIYLTWYISHAERKIKRMEKTVSEKEDKISKLEQLINNNIDSLFERVRRSDTIFLLERLLKIPQDIVNVEQLLLTRDLIPEDFIKLKDAYNKLCSQKQEKEISALGKHSFGELYMFVFFQHFLGESILDNSLRDAVMKSFVIMLDCSFKNDVEKAAVSLSHALSNKTGYVDRAEVLYCFRRALNTSKFAEDSSLSYLIKRELNDDSLWIIVDNRLKDEE